MERSDQHHLQEEVIYECGRPVLVVPADFDAETIGTHVIVGWNDTREAARAAHDALDILQEGARAHLLRVHGEDDDLTHDATLTELAQAYARHNVETSIGHRAWQRHQVAEIIELEAFERGCDLIAVGAFSHSRAYAVIHGAATRDLCVTPNDRFFFRGNRQSNLNRSFADQLAMVSPKSRRWSLLLDVGLAVGRWCPRAAH